MSSQVKSLGAGDFFAAWALDESSIDAIQRLIGAAWAEGIDPEGRAAFPHGLRASPTRVSRAEDAVTAIGATELLAALLHLRIDAAMLEVHMGVGGARALYDAVRLCLEQGEAGGTYLPMCVSTAAARGAAAVATG